jgi:hypothetical protein
MMDVRAQVIEEIREAFALEGGSQRRKLDHEKRCARASENLV